MIPRSPRDLGLPVDGWWPHQREAVARILEEFQRHRAVILQAPTGSGKTIIGAAVARLLRTPCVDLTHTIQLQEQKLGIIPGAASVKGRGNYPCLVEGLEALTADLAPCARDEPCPEGREQDLTCPYYFDRAKALASPHAVLNYAYALRSFRGTAWRKGRGLVICDEAHLLEEEIIRAASTRIPFVLPPAREDWGVEEVREWARGRLPVAREKLEKARSPQDLRRWAGIVKRLSEICAIDPGLYVRIGPELRPLWGREVSGQLWSVAPRVLLMSATISDPEVLAWRLGLEDWAFVDMPSSFPPERRPVVYLPVARLNHHSGEAEWSMIVHALWKLQERHRDEKGIIHTASGQQARWIAARLNDVTMTTRFLVYSSAEKRLDAFVHSEEPLVLVTASLRTGLDLPYIVNWQAIVKVPFGDLKDPVTRMRLAHPVYGRRWYDEAAMNAVVQAAGRAMRRPDDRGVTYILDANYGPLHARTKRPRFYEEAFRTGGFE